MLIDVDAKKLLRALGVFTVVCVITNNLQKHLRKREKERMLAHELFDELFAARGLGARDVALVEVVKNVSPSLLVKVALQQHSERGNDDRLSIMMLALDRMGSSGSRHMNNVAKKLRKQGYNL